MSFPRVEPLLAATRTCASIRVARIIGGVVVQAAALAAPVLMVEHAGKQYTALPATEDSDGDEFGQPLFASLEREKIA